MSTIKLFKSVKQEYSDTGIDDLVIFFFDTVISTWDHSRNIASHYHKHLMIKHERCHTM